MALRIILVDDHEVVRLGLKALLARHPQFQVIEEASNATEAVEKTLALKPDVVVMDIRLPGRSGIDACREIVSKQAETKVIMLTSYAEDELLFEAIAAGASGYVLKQIGSGDLVRALETVGQGGTLLDPSLTQQVFAKVREATRRAEGSSFAEFTDQEMKILALVAQGKTNREIAQVVFLSEKTVRNYVSTILGKLGMSTRSQAAAFAVQHRIQDFMASD